jgi:polyisoprenoid-binding protein YceI
MLKLYTILSVLFLTSATTFILTQWKYVPKNALVKFFVKEADGYEEGVFTGLDGKVFFDEKDLKASSVLATISVATVNSGVDMRDKALVSKDFFEAKKYPKIKFASTQIIKTDSGYTAIGNLTIKAVTKKIELPFSFTKTNDSTASFNGTFTIDRYDYGVGDKTDGVGNIVRIELTIPVKK